VDLLSCGEEAHLKFSDGHTGCADWALPSVETLEKAFGVVREPLRLPRFSRTTHREYCGPQRPVDQRVLAIEQLRGEDIRMLGELRQDGEDEVSLGMTPP
jgi:hypothetical protein